MLTIVQLLLGALSADTEMVGSSLVTTVKTLMLLAGLASIHSARQQPKVCVAMTREDPPCPCSH